MRVKICARNYRCFTEEHPLIFEIGPGDSVAFIGVNNAGKSVPHRFIYEMQHLWRELSNANFLTLGLNQKSIVVLIRGTSDPYEIFNYHNERDILLDLYISGYSVTNAPLGLSQVSLRILKKKRNSNELFIELVEVRNQTTKIVPKEGTFSLTGSIISEKVDIREADGNVTSANEQRFDVLKTSGLFNFLESSMYIGAFRNALNVGTADYLDLKVGTGFIENWNIWSEGNDVTKQRKITKLISEIGDLLDLKGLEITASSDKKTLNIKHDGNKFKLDNVGSGIAQIIIILGNLVTASPRLVMIDEPELNLHPSLQVKFMNLIEKYCEGIIFSTHSIGLARSCAQRIYSVKKLKDSSQVQNWNNETSFLEIAGELSYSAWNDIGLEKILLCEGPTEVKCFQYFLRKFKADHKVLVFPLGGSSLISGSKEKELAELLRLNKPLYCIVDSEKNSAGESLPKDRKEFSEICMKLGIKILVLERRSLDNYLTENAIAQVKGAGFTALSEFENLKDHFPRWQKNENYKIFEYVSQEALEQMDFYKFLKENFG